MKFLQIMNSEFTLFKCAHLSQLFIWWTLFICFLNMFLYKLDRKQPVNVCYLEYFKRQQLQIQEQQPFVKSLSSDMWPKLLKADEAK